MNSSTSQTVFFHCNREAYLGFFTYQTVAWKMEVGSGDALPWQQSNLGPRSGWEIMPEAQCREYTAFTYLMFPSPLRSPEIQKGSASDE